MEIRDKIVEFDKYCEKCRFKDKKESDEPCHECLIYPVNENSKKPVNFKEKEKK